MADTLKNLQYMTINKGMKHIIGGDKMSHFPDMRIQDDSTLYAKLLAKKRSTFDRSKFEDGIVGAPTITDDGIANGFSFDNYLHTSTINFTNNFTIKNKVYLTGQTEEAIFGNNGGNVFQVTYNPTTQKVAIVIKDSNNNNIFNYSYGYSQIQLNTYNFFKIVADGNIYKVQHSLDDVVYNDVATTINSNILGNRSILLGGSLRASGTMYARLLGSIDLKQFSITVDGKEIFNGNKTGIDQIKKDDYTIVGNPAITADGIASGFLISTTGYDTSMTAVKTTGFTLGQLKDKPYKISCDFTVPAPVDAAGWHTLFSLSQTSPWNAWANSITLAGISNNFKIASRFGTDGVNVTPVGERTLASIGLTVGGIYTYTVEFDGVSLYTYKILEGATVKGVWTYTPATTDKNLYAVLNFPNETINIGNSWSDVQTKYYGWTNSIDLNSFKVYVDEQLVYQPTLRIPYTQSKTGSKIVDAVYRDRVQDMYEQFGYTHYYTIGDVSEKYNIQVVGNPTFVGGIASNFGNLAYARVTSFNPVDSKWEITIKFTTDSDVSTFQSIIGNDGINNRLRLACTIDKHLQWRVGKDGASTLIFSDSFNEILLPNTTYFVKLIYDGNNYIGKISKDGLQYTTKNFYTTTDKIYNINNTGLSLGSNKYSATAYEAAFKGSIDLSQFAIEIDGKEVFRGYEPAITDAFTLATNKGTDIIGSYSDGEGTYYELRADLIQRCVGQIPINTTEVNYPREFRNDKNIVQVAYFNVGESTATPTIAHIAPKVQTKSGFTIGATTNLPRNYYAEGKAVLG